MTAEESMTTPIDWEQQIEESGPIMKRKGRKTKEIELIGEDDEQEDEDASKFSDKGRPNMGIVFSNVK